MPIEPRPSDEFTRDHLLVGFPTIEFTPTLSTGLPGVPVELGILASADLVKEINYITLERGDAGFLTVDREIVSRLRPSWEVSTYNIRSDVAKYVFGSDVVTAIVADPAASVVNEPFTLPSGANAERMFVNLANGDIDEATFVGTSITCAPITAEAVGTGDGTTGDTAGDFSLDFKPLIVGDVTSITVGGVAYTPVAVGAAVAGLEVEVAVGATATSGDLQFFNAGVATNVTGAIVATYSPSHAFANLTDYVVDPWLGKIRMLNIDGATDALKSGQPMLADYSYNRKAGWTLQPFRENQVNGTAIIRHLPDVGSNFKWTIPSATVLLTDDNLTFGAENFATASLRLNVNDAGGTNRFGTMQISSEPQSA